MKKHKLIPFFVLLVAAVLILGVFYKITIAEQQVSQVVVDYKGQPVVDSDLDGLTDEGEKQIYHTDPNNPDTDGDGYYDGVEVVNGTNPLDPNDLPANVKQDLLNKAALQLANGPENVETPWAWYVSRASGLLGFALLYISIFLGLTIRIRFLHRIFAPLYALNAHAWLALQATLFALAHGVVLIFDKTVGMSLRGVLVPGMSGYETELVALGTVGFYLMLLLTVTSYARRRMSHAVWRAVHFLNLGLYFIVVIHALLLGTDLKTQPARDIFIALNEFLVLLMLVNMFLRIKDAVARKRIANQSGAVTSSAANKQ